ncbi:MULTISPECIES: hypothetical protein [unclassified Frankia]|uniref:hypothetical protein n=1 Tax=unclassified Frankia TaxID=2632575 RepID=UPI001EF42B8E|nr:MULTISPECIES: hypothetical protein [unclassified Frankia]
MSLVVLRELAGRRVCDHESVPGGLEGVSSRAMPCFRCHVRQTDPARGSSPWRRAVVDGEQVLFCPPCQQVTGWSEVLDRCDGCGSTQLAKALGAVSCRDCGRESSPVSAGEGLSAASPQLPRGSAGRQAMPVSPDLSDEIGAALARVLGRAVT